MVSMAGGSSITFTTSVPYDHVLLTCLTSTGTGSIAVTVDGASVGTACGTPSPTSNPYVYNLFTSSTVSLGTHMTVLACTGQCYVYGISGEAGITGIVVDNYAVGGANSQWFGGNAATNMAWADLTPPNLAIFDLQTNDNAEGITTSQFTSYMTAAINNVQALGTAPSVLIAVPPYGGIGTQSGSQAFATAQLALAQSVGADYISMQDRMGSAYNANSGLWNSNHPNDKLSLDEFSADVCEARRSSA